MGNVACNFWLRARSVKKYCGSWKSARSACVANTRKRAGKPDTGSLALERSRKLGFVLNVYRTGGAVVIAK